MSTSSVTPNSALAVCDEEDAVCDNVLDEEDVLNVLLWDTSGKV